MEKHVARMVQEHSELVSRIEKLDNFLYGNGGLNIHTHIKNNQTQDELLRNMTEYANKCMQLMNMRSYLNALTCRLNNEGIRFENGTYFEAVATMSNCYGNCNHENCDCENVDGPDKHE